MRGRDFLAVARGVVRGATEAHWRAAVVDAYYALFLECREALRRWGRPVPPKQNVHRDVRIAFIPRNNPDVKFIGDTLDELGRTRGKASYDLGPLPWFATAALALRLIHDAGAALALLDAIEADPARLAAAIASLPPPPP